MTRPSKEVRLLLLTVLFGVVATTVFLVTIAVGTEDAVRSVGYVVGIGALCDLTLTLGVKAVRKR